MLDDANQAQSPTVTPELFAQIKAIQIRTQRLVTDMLAGNYESAFKGRGMEFDKVREYQAGDDVRHIDWNVTARMQAPYVKQYAEERQLTVMLLVDVSSSGAFGSQKRFKSEIAAEIAAVLAYTAIRSNDRVGLIILTDHVEHYIPPKKGRAHVWRVIRDILSFHPERQQTRIAAGLEYLNRVMPQRAVTFIISDFIDTQFSETLRISAQRHDITAIWINDPRERTLPDVGLLELEDAETGERVLLDTHNPAVQRYFHRLNQQNIVARRDILYAAQVDLIDIPTETNYIEPIVRYFQTRERRRYR